MIVKKALGYLFVAGLLLGLTACSKDEDELGLEEATGEGYISMKVNGKLWKSDLAGLTTFFNEEEIEGGEFLAVYMMGLKCEDCEDAVDPSEEVESLSINLLIPIGKYNNPKGTYMGGNLDDPNPKGESLVYYTVKREGEGVWDYYISTDALEEGSKGKLEINDFKTGKFEFFGAKMEGYTKLSGTFEYELFKAAGEDESPEKLVITEGKFLLSPVSWAAGF